MKYVVRALSGLLMLLGMVLPTDATAQFQNKSWLVCGGNYFNTCASVDVTVGGLVTATNQRLVTLRVMNLSGMNGTYGASVFTKIGFFNIVGASAIGPAATASGPLLMSGDLIVGDSDWRTSNNGTAPQAWVLADVSNAGGIELDLSTASGTNSSVKNGIASQCLPSGLPGGSNAFWWNDCYADAASVNFADYVQLSFNVSGLWDLAGTDMLIQVQNGPGGASAQCITGTGPKGNCGPTTVVPEPISMILLGTGLAGVGGVNYLRRRRDEDEDGEGAIQA